jgi:hypothetical protein
MNNRKYKHVRVVSCACRVDVNHGCGTGWKGGWAAECWGGFAQANVAKALTWRVSGRGPSFRFIVASRHLCRPTTKAAAVGPPIGTVCAQSRPATHTHETRLRSSPPGTGIHTSQPCTGACRRPTRTCPLRAADEVDEAHGAAPATTHEASARHAAMATSPSPHPTGQRKASTPAAVALGAGSGREQRADTRPPPAAAQAHARTRAPEEARRKYSPPPLTCGADRRQFEDASFHDATPGPRLYRKAALATAANCAVRGIY